MPLPTDPAPVWQAWVAAGVGTDERHARFAKVPEPYRSRVASHMRTVQAIERWQAQRRSGTDRTVAKANRRVDRPNPNAG